MCLILLAYDQHPRFRFIMAANRDEFYARPTAPAQFWDDYPYIFAGRDLKQMGTWMGVTKNGGVAALTNYRERPSADPRLKSRGELVSRYLIDQVPPLDYLHQIKGMDDQYQGYNLIIGDRSSLYYYSNRNKEIVPMKQGVHGLSNHLLNTPWPKVEKGKQGLRQLLSAEHVDPERLFQLLADSEPAKDDELPDTGVGLGWERTLSPLFIRSADYGTRSSTVLLIDRQDHVCFVERTFKAGEDAYEEVSVEFDLSPSETEN